MYDLEKLTESIYDIDSDQRLKEQLIEKSNWYKDDPCCKFAHLVFADNRNNISIVYFRVGHTVEMLEERKPFKEALIDFLKECKNPGFADLMFFMRIYEHHSHEIGRMINPSFRKNNALDSLLKETRGFLMWEHQMEMVIRLFAPELSMEETRCLREDLQYGKDSAAECIKKMEWEGMTLYDAAFERAMYNCSIVGGSPASDLSTARQLYMAIK